MKFRPRVLEAMYISAPVPDRSGEWVIYDLGKQNSRNVIRYWLLPLRTKDTGYGVEGQWGNWKALPSDATLVGTHPTYRQGLIAANKLRKSDTYG